MSAHSFSCRVIGCGAWSDSFDSWPALVELLKNKEATPKEIKGPKPEVIPANERRRAPLPVRLAVESSWQATQVAGMDPKELCCVFVSGFGDTQLTDYMCKVLATDSKELSPTKFHNSVHNAAAGYWTISTGCEKAANSVAGFQDSVPLALMEAVIQCHEEQVPILITFFDAPVSAVLTDIMGGGSSFAFSMIIAPEYMPFPQQESQENNLRINVVAESCDWPVLQSEQPTLRACYSNNPSARILPLLETLLGVSGTKEVQYPISEQLSILLSAD